MTPAVLKTIHRIVCVLSGVSVGIERVDSLRSFCFSVIPFLLPPLNLADGFAYSVSPVP